LKSIVLDIEPASSSGDVWSYELKTLARGAPLGQGHAQVIVTQYDLPRAGNRCRTTSSWTPKGLVWYTDFGSNMWEDWIPGQPRSPSFRFPVLKPGFPLGILEVDTTKPVTSGSR